MNQGNRESIHEYDFLRGKYKTLGGLSRNDVVRPTFQDCGAEEAGPVFVYDSRRKAIVVSLPVEEMTTAVRATRTGRRAFGIEDQIRLVRDGVTGKLAILTAA